jgi:hypothetical protein
MGRKDPVILPAATRGVAASIVHFTITHRDYVFRNLCRTGGLYREGQAFSLRVWLASETLHIEANGMFRKIAISCFLGLVTIAWANAPVLAEYPCYDPYSVPLGTLAPYSVYSSDYVPYFISHPPVYYGRVVARPYGFSPYPASAGLVPAEVYVSRPVIIRNMYCQSEANAQEAVNSAPVPLRIKNPFAAK